MELRKYITDNGYEMMLPATDERVMTIDELISKNKTGKNEKSKKAEKSQICPKCKTYCYGDCHL